MLLDLGCGCEEKTFVLVVVCVCCGGFVVGFGVVLFCWFLAFSSSRYVVHPHGMMLFRPGRAGR